MRRSMDWMYGLPLLLTISAVLCHPYGPPSSNQHRQPMQPTPSSYQSSGNDQLRFHPEESQYYEAKPTNNAAPSYADLVNLQQQEAQQQAIIDAQKKLETNKLVKDIEFIQRQQEMLQEQIRQQEVKNEQQLSKTSYTSQSNAGAYSATQNNLGGYSEPQSNPGASGPGNFNSGQWTPDNNAQKFDNGMYNSDGSQNQVPSDGSFACDSNCNDGDASKSNTQIMKFQQNQSFQQQASSSSQSQFNQQSQQSASQTASGYGGSSPSSGVQSGGYPEFQSPQYPSQNPSAPFPTNPTNPYEPSPSPPTFPQPKPPGSYGASSPPQFPPQQPQYPVSQPAQQPFPSKPSYGGSSGNFQTQHHQEQQLQHNTQDYWWNGPNSPFSPNQLGNCNHLDCNPPAINKPSQPNPAYGPTLSETPSPPVPQSPPSYVPPPNQPPQHAHPLPQTPPPYTPPINQPPQHAHPIPAEPVNYAQNPYLSGTLGNPKPPPQGPPPSPSYAPPPQSFPPPPYGAQPTSPVQPPSQQPYVPPPSLNSPEEFPQKPFPTKPAYKPPPPPQPSPPLTNPPSSSGGYGQSAGGTPGISFPEYQPDDVQRVPCSQPGYTCVAKHLCLNGKVNNNGIGIIQLRITQKSCRADIEVCCQEVESPSSGYSPPSQPSGGYSPSSGGYDQPSSNYNQPPETCNMCGGSGFTHQQSHHAEETSSYNHKESSSASLTQGNMPRAQLPDFVPPSATATLPLLKQQSHSPSAGYGK